MTIHYPGLPPGWDNHALERAIRQIMGGHLNVTRQAVTLTANAASTALADSRLSAQTWIGWMPTTANASAEIGAGTIYVSARGDGTATITHANNAQTDRTFDFIFLG